MTNYEMIKKIAKNASIETVKELLEKATEEIRKEEESYKTMIPASKYAQTTGKFEYPAWVDETLQEVTNKMGISIYRYGDCTHRSMKITRDDFAKYIIYTCNDNGIMLQNVIEVLTAAPAWCTGRGITRSRMELVFHILVLHKENLSETKDELKKLLRRNDPTSLKVFANADDDFRNVLDYDAKMISFAEKKVCEKTGKVTEFKVA